MKSKINIQNALYPMPVTIVGANIDGKPNYITIAHVGILKPDIVSLGISKTHYTNMGIFENKTFSINLPSEDMVIDTDYVGLESGKYIDKSKLFNTFYGDLKTAPMITDAPISIECNLIDNLDYKTHDVFIGRVSGVYVTDEVLKNGIIDLNRVKPMLFDMFQKKYWKLGKSFADCWKVGMQKKK